MSWKSAAERKRRLKKLCEDNGRSYFSENKNRYIRYYMSNGRDCGARRFFKKYSNRIIRKNLNTCKGDVFPREKCYHKNGAFVDSWNIDDW